ncbi:Atp-Binding Cassette Sub-Family C Member 9, partial [Manis pentadactyla]
MVRMPQGTGSCQRPSAAGKDTGPPSGGPPRHLRMFRPAGRPLLCSRTLARPLV